MIKKSSCSKNLQKTSKYFQTVSSNWRLDFYKFQKLSCAEVLKLAIKNDRVNGGIQYTSENAPKKVTTQLMASCIPMFVLTVLP